MESNNNITQQPVQPPATLPPQPTSPLVTINPTVSKPNIKKILLIVLPLVFLLIAGALGVWYFYFRPLKTSHTAITAQQPKTQLNVPTNTNNIYILEDDGTLDIDGNFETSIDTNAVTKAFFDKYPDTYDFMAVFPAFTPKKEFDAIASTYEIRNDVRGICREVSNCLLFESCYSNQLKSMSLFTARKNNYDELVKSPEEVGYIVLHEMAHHWGAQLGNWGVQTGESLPANGKLPDGVNESCTHSDIPLVKTDSSHWSRGLVMPYPAIDAIEEALPWKDRGGGIYTYDMNLYNKPRKYHPFDLYLMGFLGPSQITDEFTLLTDMEDYCCDLPDGTKIGEKEFGIKVKKSFKVTIQDVVKIAGEERKPSVETSQKDFKIAFVILVKKGQKPSENMIKTIEYVSKVLPERWAFATQNLSTLNK